MINTGNYTYTGVLDEVHRALGLLLKTRVGSVPLDREFGIDMSFIDKPVSVAKSLYTAEVTEKASRFIPSVRVREITWDGSESGLNARVVIEDV